MATKGVTFASEGVLGYKGPGLVKSLRFSKRFIYFQDEPIPVEQLFIYRQNEKAAVVNAMVAWASQTGKGLLFLTKSSEDKATPGAIINLADMGDVTTDSLEIHFKVNGQRHTFQTTNMEERDTWIATLKAKSAIAKSEKDSITSSESYKAEFEKLTKSSQHGSNQEILHWKEPGMSLDFLPAETADITGVAGLIAELRDIVGADGVLDGDGGEFRDPFQPESWTAFWPSAVVQPTTADQVRAVVKAANKHQVPLWTQGQGRNNGYGGAGPRVSGGITINFRKMNRVIEINEELAYAEVEPGVSFEELHAEIRRQGKRLMVAVPDLGWGGVVSNALEHGLTYTPVGKDFNNLCGLEVVTADGDLLRTNMGAQDGNAAWHLYRRSFGPSLDTLFMQSNMGIITRAGVWLQPAPEVIYNCHVDVKREEDLVPLVDTLRKLRLDGTIDGVPCILNTLLLATTFGTRASYADITGDTGPSMPLTDKQIDKIAAHLKIGRWHLRFSFYNDDAIVDLQYAKAKKAFEAIPGAVMYGSKTTWDDAPNLENSSDLVYSAIPNLDWKDMGAWYGGDHGGHMSFAPVVPLTGEAEYAVHQWTRRFFESRGFDYSCDAIVANARSVCHVTGISYDFDNLEETERAYRTLQDLCREAGRELKIGEYRAHPHYMDIAQDLYDFNDHAYRRFVEKIKDAVDPSGILSPGKQGIWPAKYR